MLIRNLDKYGSIYGKVDALLIVNKENIIEYSAMVNDDNTYLRTKDLVGKSLFEFYPNLNEENITHARVMRTGQPIINEKQLIVEKTGKSYAINTSTFPLESNGELIGTIDISCNLTLTVEKDGFDKNRDELYKTDSIITKNKSEEYYHQLVVATFLHQVDVHLVIH